MELIPYGYCHCGCGQKTRIPTEKSTEKGWEKGVPLKYINHHNTMAGEKSPRWKGGRRLRPDGYILAYIGKGEARLEHRVVAEQHYGGPLPKGSIVHHCGSSRDDNTKLMLFASHAEHATHHANERALQNCGHADWRKCSICKQYDDPANLTYVKSNRSRYHKTCAAQRVAEQRARWKSEGKKRKS